MAIIAEDITNLEATIRKIIAGDRKVTFTTIDSSYTYQQLDLKQARELMAEWKIQVNSAAAAGSRRSRIFRTRYSKGL